MTVKKLETKKLDPVDYKHKDIPFMFFTAGSLACELFLNAEEIIYKLTNNGIKKYCIDPENTFFDVMEVEIGKISWRVKSA